VGLAVDSKDAVLDIDVGDGRPVGIPAIPRINEDLICVWAGLTIATGSAVTDCDPRLAKGIEGACAVVDALVDVDKQIAVLGGANVHLLDRGLAALSGILAVAAVSDEWPGI
jgi:hypothetical protein